MQGVKRGDLVEFTMFHHRSYPPADMSLVLFGVAIENEGDSVSGSVRVRMADGTERLASYIQAYAWAGWMPEDLEPVFEEINADTMDGFDDEY